MIDDCYSMSFFEQMVLISDNVGLWLLINVWWACLCGYCNRICPHALVSFPSSLVPMGELLLYICYDDKLLTDKSKDTYMISSKNCKWQKGGIGWTISLHCLHPLFLKKLWHTQKSYRDTFVVQVEQHTTNLLSLTEVNRLCKHFTLWIDLF